MDPLSLLSWVGAAIDSQLSAVVTWATAGFNALLSNIFGLQGVLDGFIDWVKNALGSIVTWLGSLWAWLRDHVIDRLRDLFARIKDKLAKIFGPLKRMIDQYRRMLQQLWQIYVKPIYDFIQRLRRVLVIFRLLGFKWAKRLDARLVKIETAISDAFLAVWANLNQLSNWINYILDPFGLIQPNVWLKSIQQSVGAIIGIVTGRMTDPGFSGPAGHYSTPAGYYDAGAVKARVAARARVGVLPEDQDAIASLRASAASMGYTR